MIRGRRGRNWVRNIKGVYWVGVYWVRIYWGVYWVGNIKGVYGRALGVPETITQ